MSIRGMLVHSCTIQDRTESDAGGSGHATYSWTDTATSVPCRFYGYAQGRETVQGKETGVADFRMDFLPDQTISRESRVVYGGDTYEVKSVLPMSDGNGSVHHQLAFLQLVG